MARVFWLLGVLLLAVRISSAGPTPPVKYAPVKSDGDEGWLCGTATITTKFAYCTEFNKCDKAGIVEGQKSNRQKFVEKEKTFAVCDKKILDYKVQVRIDENPYVWKYIKSITCEEISGGNATVNVVFEKEHLKYNVGMKPNHFALRCFSKGDRARFDIYDFSERSRYETSVGLYHPIRFYLFFVFMSLLITTTAMAVYYVFYLCLGNRKLKRSVFRRQTRHDELYLTNERWKNKYDAEEVWNAMPLIHQQVAAEAAFFLQKYKSDKFTPELRQWITDRGYPTAATEIILHLAGLGDGDFYPFNAKVERTGDFKNAHKLDEFGDRIEARIVDTLNYANRLRRRKIVFTDHRWLELHHLFFELLLNSIGVPSHPTIHDADIPVLPRHAFGTRDDPREEERESRETALRQRKPHFLQYDWDEAQRLLGSDA